MRRVEQLAAILSVFFITIALSSSRAIVPEERRIDARGMLAFRVCYGAGAEDAGGGGGGGGGLDAGNACVSLFDLDGDGVVTLADYRLIWAFAEDPDEGNSCDLTPATDSSPPANACGIKLSGGLVTNPQSATASQFGNPFFFTGQRYDHLTGLYHFTFRSYSPSLGRFLQEDPMGPLAVVNVSIGNLDSGPTVSALDATPGSEYTGTMQLWLYTESNPINATDPFGQFSIPDQMVTGGLYGGLLGAFFGGVQQAMQPNGNIGMGIAAGFAGGVLGGATGGAAVYAFGASATGLWGTLTAGAAIGGSSSYVGGFAQSYTMTGNLGQALADAQFTMMLGFATGGLTGALSHMLMPSSATQLLSFNSFSALK